MRILDYPLVGRIAFRQQIRYPGAVMMRTLFFVMVMYIFASIWRVVYEDTRLIAGFTMVQSLWYLSFTEVVEMGKSRLLGPIQNEVKEGTIAYSLLRPYDYVGFYLSQGFGESLVSALPLLVSGFAAALLLAGPLPGYWMAIGPGLVLLAGGLVLNMLIQIIVGLLAFWMEESTPVYWIIQKLTFILGGLFFPLDFFPAWLGDVSRNLPFAYILYWPARTLVDFSAEVWLRTLGGQLVYGAGLYLLARYLFRKGLRRVEANGG